MKGYTANFLGRLIHARCKINHTNTICNCYNGAYFYAVSRQCVVGTLYVVGTLCVVGTQCVVGTLSNDLNFTIILIELTQFTNGRKQIIKLI